MTHLEVTYHWRSLIEGLKNISIIKLKKISLKVTYGEIQIV